MRVRDALLLVATLSCFATKATAQGLVEPATNVAEQYLQSAADQERAALQLPLLRRDPALVAAARAHALEMVSHGRISHQFPNELDLAARGSSAGARFSLISENVAESPSAVTIHAAWMKSEGHRHNLLDPNVDAVGIAVIARSHQLFAVEDFQRSVVDMTLQQQESAVAVSIAATGISIRETSSAARDACAEDGGQGMGRHPDFVMRYTTADLGRLPEQLHARLATGIDSIAVVGACLAKKDGDYSMYRIAVLLYR